MRRFYRQFFHIVLVFLWLGLPVNAIAQDSFFSEQVAVADRGSVELSRAAREGLTRLLIKVSGNEAILDEAAFREAVGSAQQHVLLYSYREDDAGDVVFLEFDDAFVRNLFRDESVPYWEQRRPPVVVWVALDEPFSRRFAARSDDVDLLVPSIERFKARGVEARFPLLDLTDAATVPVNTLWTRDFDQIRRGSRRYGSDHSLVGRWIDLSDGSKLVDWYYVSPGGEIHKQMRLSDLDAIWDAGVDLAVDSMRDSLAVTLQQFEISDAIAVTVRGVNSFADYRAVSTVFKQLAELIELRIDSVSQDTLTYRVIGVSSAEEVARLIPSRSGLRVQSATNRAQRDLTWESIQGPINRLSNSAPCVGYPYSSPLWCCYSSLSNSEIS